MDRFEEVMYILSANAIEAGRHLAGDKTASINKPISIGCFANGSFYVHSANTVLGHFKNLNDAYNHIVNSNKK